MEVRFLIDEKSVEAMTWEELETFERAQEGEMKIYNLRPILARFMVNGSDKVMPHDKAMKALGTLPMSKIKETIELFMGALKDGTVPKVNENSSEQPSEPSSAVSEFPDGSE